MKVSIISLVVVVSITTFGHGGEYGGKEVVYDAEDLSMDQHDPPNRWHLRVGGAYRSIGGIDVTTRGYSNHLSLPSLVGRSRSGSVSGIGDLSGYADREYDDGYVRTSGPTPGTGETWHWGYHNGSQVAGGSLSLHKSGGLSHRVSRSSSGGVNRWDDSPEAAGPFIEFDYDLMNVGGVAIGPQLGFMWFGFDAENTSTTFNQTQVGRSSRNHAIDTYDLRGIIPPLAPYAGGAGGPGALLRNKPDSRRSYRTSAGSQTAHFHNAITEALDLDVYTFSLGGQARADLGRIGVTAAAGLTVNITDLTATRRETLFVSKGGGSQRATRVGRIASRTRTSCSALMHNWLSRRN